MTDLRIMLKPEDAGEAAELDEDGNFNQIEMFRP